MISVIVPVYNAESTIRRCVNSIIDQVYRNWELILVDDGSTDSSLAICKQYAENHDSIHVIHKQNGGVSSARNIGMESAIGQWIIFVDADDYLDGDYFSVVENSQCDLIIQQTYFYSLNGELSHFQPIPPEIINGTDNLQSFFSKYLSYHVFLAPWGKIFRKKLISNLRFVEKQIVGEDTVFNQQAIANIKSIEISEKGHYCYYDVGSHNKYELVVLEAISYISRVYSAYKNHGYKNDSYLALELNFFTYVCRKDALRNAPEWFGNKVVKEIFSQCKQELTCLHRWKFFIFRVPYMFRVYHMITGKWV